MEPISLFFLCGTLISSELWIMRIFSVTSWAHFGSMVVGIAMLAFGASSVLLSIKTSWFQKHINRILTLSLLLFAPLLMASNAFVQKISFNPLFLASDPEQKWNLLFFFLAYFIPFFSAAFFVGLFFLKHKDHFGKMYFADMTGSGFGGILFLLSLWVLPPPLLFLVPLFLYLCAAVS